MSVCPSISTTASSKSCLDPEFLKAIPIMKTRSGMQVCMHLGACILSQHVFMCFCSLYIIMYILNIAVVPYVFEGTALCTSTWALHMYHMYMGTSMHLCIFACEQRLYH